MQTWVKKHQDSFSTNLIKVCGITFSKKFLLLSNSWKKNDPKNGVKK